MHVVFLLQQLLGANCLRVLDALFVQCPLHRPSASCHRYFRPVRLRTNPRPLPSTLHAWTEECVLHADTVLAVGRQRFVPQYRTCDECLHHARFTDVSVQVLFGFSVILFWGDLKQATGFDSGHWFWGTTLYLAVLLTVLGKAALISEYVCSLCGCSSH